MDMNKFSREELMLAGVALLLAIDLLFLPWFDVTVGIGAFKASFTSSATGEPDGWLGVLAVLALLALIADLGLERLGNVALPAVNGSRGDTRLVALKFLFHIHFSLFGIGFWVGVVLTAALVITAVRARDAERMTPTLA